MASTPARNLTAIHQRSLITPDGEEALSSPSSSIAASPPPLLSVGHAPHSPLQLETAAAEVLVDKRRYLAPEPLDRDRKRRRRLASDTLDSVNKNRNVILPLNQLLNFIENSFCCKRCHTSLTRCDEEQEEEVRPLGLGVFDLACGLNFKCECGVRQSLRPATVPEATPKLKTLQDGNPYGT